VAVTGFLPGVLSFLCALSHLERIAHRPTTCSSSLNHLSHLKRVLNNWPTIHTQSSTAWPQQPTGKQTQAFPNWFSNHRMVSQSRLRDRDSTHRLALSDKGCIGFPNLTQALSESTLRLLVQRVYGVYSYRGWVGRTVQQIGSNEGETPIIARFSSFHCHYSIVPQLWFRDCVTSNSRRGRHRLHGSEQRCTGSSEQTQAFSPFQNCTRVSCRGHTVHAQDSPGSNGGGTPQHGSSQPFIACARVDTCHPCDCMHSFSMCSSHHLENHMSFQKDLG
jgi:hypothetical protein